MIDNMDDFHRLIGSQDRTRTDCPLKQAFWSCSRAFSLQKASSAKANEMRRVWVFTNDDNPLSRHPNQNERDQVRFLTK